MSAEHEIADDHRGALSNCNFLFDVDSLELSTSSPTYSLPNIDSISTLNTSLGYSTPLPSPGEGRDPHDKSPDLSQSAVGYYPHCRDLTFESSLSLDPNELKGNLINEVDPCFGESEMLIKIDFDTPPPPPSESAY